MNYKPLVAVICLLLVVSPTFAIVIGHTPDGRPLNIVTGFTKQYPGQRGCLLYSRDYQYGDGTKYHLYVYGLAYTRYDGTMMCYLPRGGATNTADKHKSTEESNNNPPSPNDCAKTNSCYTPPKKPTPNDCWKTDTCYKIKR